MQINVVMGGPSAEYEISILSGIQVIKHLAGRNGNRVRAVVITREKSFYYHDIGAVIPEQQLFSDPEKSEGVFTGPISPAASSEIWTACDAAFLALHGSFGEDGKIQGYLDFLGIPYTGSGVFASSVAMNKIATKRMLIQSGLDTPPFTLVGERHPPQSVEAIIARHGLPCFVKCPQSGSSRLMGRATSADELSRLLAELRVEADEILVESMMHGPEFTCPVVELADGTLQTLPPVEIRPIGSAYFDFNAKYTANASEEIVPAQRPALLLERIKASALAVHRLLGCSGVSRTDMILGPDDRLYILETNTLPGLTANSLLPKSWRAAGGTYEGLVDVLIASARTGSKGKPN